MNTNNDIAVALNELDNLGFKEYEVSLLHNKYGTNDRVYIVNGKNFRDKERFVIKFFRDNESLRELQGISLLRKYLPSPQVIHANTEKGLAILKYYENSLYIDLIYQNEFHSEVNKIIEIEKYKEDLLDNLHKSTKTQINTQDYLKLHNNRLYKERILGNRYKEYFTENRENNISQLFTYNLIINGKNFKFSIDELIKVTREKILKLKNQNRTAFLDHGDAHSWNLLISDSNNDIRFIDFEYYDTIPAFMALTKPLYSDFWGNLFFYFNDTLKEIFSIKKFDIFHNDLIIDLDLNKLPTLRIELAKIKIQKRLYSFKSEKDDFLDINDYILISHLLTRNPNNYESDVQKIFIALAPLLYTSDLLDPEDIFSTLRS
jgi:hypothetical protein